MTVSASTGTEAVARLTFIHDAFATAAALAAADRLGVLARLDAGPADPATLARDCAISDHGAALLLGALASLGVVEASGNGSYKASTPPATWAALRSLWSHLDDALRTGCPVHDAQSPHAAEIFYPEVVALLGSVFASAAEHAADYLASPGQRVLDVGAGAAPWSLALARRDPTVRVTAVDLPAVLAVTRRAVSEARREAQFTFLAGDLFSLDWSTSSYDLAVAGNLCHLFDDGANRRLLTQLSASLSPGGKVAIVDALPNEGCDGPLSVTLYALGLLLRTSAGRVYPFSTYVGWLRDAGFEAIERHDLSTTPALSVIAARKPR